MTVALTVGARTVGDGQPVYVIAEVGVNHDGRLDAALALVEAAAGAGADAVKFQTFDPSLLATSDAPLAEYQQAGSATAQTQRDMLEALALGASDFRALADRCAELGIDFLSTPFDEESARLLVEIGVPALKIGSGELTNTPFLETVASLGVPVLLSTGMSDIDEVAAAIDAVRRGGDPPLALLHCVSSYPTPPEDANLRAIATLRERFDLPVGYSDHCLGTAVSLSAVALGSVILERHITPDRNLPGPDHAISLLPGELGELVRQVRTVEAALGDGVKAPRAIEADTRRVARRSLVAARGLAAGAVLTRADIAIKRPGDGLPPGRLGELIGATLARPVHADEQFTENDLAPEGQP